MVDEIIDTDTNALTKDTKDTTDIITTHDYETCKEVVNIVNMRGGQRGLIPRGGVGIILRPVANGLGYLLVKVPALRGVYKTVKTAKVIIASTIAFCSLLFLARFDYWALIISGAIPSISIDQRAVLAGIRRLRMGANDMAIIIPQSNDIINLVMDEDINLERKNQMLINLFSIYESLPESHVFKNRYFACIIHVLLTLFIINKLGFNLALKLLLNLLNNGKISLQTYREILSQLVIGGVPPIELECL
jgi:hypothetical protein